MTRLHFKASAFLLTAALGACTDITGDPATSHLLKAEEPQRLTVTVAPQRAECHGLFPRQCLVVDNQLFYDGIEGFSHETGTTYELEILRSPRAAPGQILYDVGAYRYQLIRVISETP
ncbi:DUF4377 domain-containing protein [Thalassobius sp. I31.1]|uniref:DUF4377 domain-containing protein n=1 Tax=Thalassobius sp. I31.1 TaxID=2109912 RepID=UPI000D1ADBF3|nr:DUF4377 domain-containing protein [Thalassobius sp. I31.1]